MDCIQLSLFGKTYPEHSVQTEEEISVPCWKNLPALDKRTLLFLDLRGGADGAKPEQSPETDGLWLGDSSTLNIGECPREENVSLLSWILQVDVPEKYYLSAKACRGILTRASRRGKKLQELLETALLEMIEWLASGGGASLHLENPVRLCRGRQRRTGADRKNRNTFDATGSDPFSAGLLPSRKHY
jgi:hypothetical protein